LSWLIGATEPEGKMLTVDDARALVTAALPSEAKRLPGIYADGGKVVEKGRCMPFDVLWANPGPGSAHVDFYTVDLKTAAVWRGMDLNRVNVHGLARLQRTLRRKLGVSEMEAQRAIEDNVCLR